MDKIRIRGIVCDAFLGVSEAERSGPQKVAFDLCLELDLDAAAHTDDLALTLDYHDLAATIRQTVAAQPARLLETLARRVCEAALSHPRVETVAVTARKWPRAMQGQIDCVEVEMKRGR